MQAARLTVVVGAVTHRLRPHDAPSLAEAKAHPLFARPRAALAEPSHFVPGVAFSADGVQSYQVRYRTDDGLLMPLLAGIHVPTERDVQRANAGEPPEEQDPTHLSLDDAAIWAVYTIPASSPSSPARRVRSSRPSEDAAEYDAPRYEIRRRLVAADASALVRGEARVHAQLELDAAGQGIQRRALHGTSVVGEDGASVYETSWVAAPNARIRQRRRPWRA